jgi:hypothetical protein
VSEAEPKQNKRGLITPLRLVFVVLSLGTVLFLAARILFPEHPASWYRIHDTRDLPLSEVRNILSGSGARLVSSDADGHEVWRLQHRFGAWTVSVSATASPVGNRLLNAHIRYDSTVFPRHSRMRNYPNS